MSTSTSGTFLLDFDSLQGSRVSWAVGIYDEMEEEMGVKWLDGLRFVRPGFSIFYICVCRKGVGKDGSDQPPRHIEDIAEIIDNAQTTITVQNTDRFLPSQCW